MNDPIRLALIGAGPWGRRCIETISALEGVALVRVASRNPETPNLVGPSCRVSSDWRDAAGGPGVDGVIIATPPRLHAEMARAALEAGRPVFVEKPLTMDPAEARDLLELAEKRRGYVLVDHIHLFNPGYEALKDRAKALGRPRALRTSGGNQGPVRPDTPPLWDYGPHDVALCLDFLGTRPAAVGAAVERSERTGKGRRENVRLRLKFPGPLEADIRVGNLFEKRERRFEVDFLERAAVFDDVARRLTLHALDARSCPVEPGEDLPFAAERPLSRALKAFLAAVRAGSRDLSSLRLGLEVVEILAAAQARLPT